MTQQSLLAQIATHYDFNKANQILSLPQVKPFSRSWMTLDLSQTLAKIVTANNIQFAVPYQQEDQYYKYQVKSDQVEQCEKRFASKADLKLTTTDKNYWFEFHTLHQDDLANKKERQKLYDDVNRVNALRKIHPKDDIILLIGLWGRFSSEDIKHFQPLDNSSQCAYVLDSSLKGSTQIARLTQMKKEGKERCLLIGL